MKKTGKAHLYVIAGASRSGKTILADQLLNEKNVPYFLTDFLSRPLKIARGEEVDPPKQVRRQQERKKDFIAHAEKNWNSIYALLISISSFRKNYCLEGEVFLPRKMHNLEHNLNAHLAREEENNSFKFGINIVLHTCFLGYTQVDIAKKLKAIRQFPSTGYDWVQGLSDKDVRDIIKKRIEFSKYLQKECEKYDLPYIDTSENFEEKIQEAFKLLTEE